MIEPVKISDEARAARIERLRADRRCASAAASIRAATGFILATGPKTRDLGGFASTAGVTQAIRNALSNSANSA